MRTAEPVRGPRWDITVPSRPVRLRGLAMAGFSDNANEYHELALVPHPAVTVLIELGEPSFVIEDDLGARESGRVVSGLAPHGLRGRGLTRETSCLQLRLSPLLAHELLGAAPELGGAVVSLDELWGRDAARLQERLTAAPTWEERFAIAESELIRRRENARRAVDPEVAHCWRRMMARRGRIRVERLGDEVGWSRKRLWSRFRAQAGLTPKRAARLIRFDHAVHRLAAGQDPASAAADSGYADQSHLHRDVVAFSGMTPAAVAAAPFLSVDDVAWPGRDRFTG
ncbi:helix-turn-helix domain-containing protein [Nonomuraea sp. NPDC049309]|uniref:helix-turn-helix domain-containing protein n=1 Tax=Nonomuraea sp. NPDC049309 TaxID=3364350 RepID=UPI0037192612